MEATNTVMSVATQPSILKDKMSTSIALIKFLWSSPHDQ